MKQRFQSVNTIIVDEGSMIGCSTLHNISKQLCNAKHIAGKAFGGVDILFFGDFIQFPPVIDSPLYAAWKDAPFISRKSQAEQRKVLGMELWKKVYQVVLLDEQMRVNHKPYQDLLNRLREGKCIDRDIEILNKRNIGNF